MQTAAPIKAPPNDLLPSSVATPIISPAIINMKRICCTPCAAYVAAQNLDSGFMFYLPVGMKKYIGRKMQQ